MYSMPAFVYHGCHIMHLARSIHENKRSPAFCEGTIVAAGSFSFPAFQVEVTNSFHCLKAISEERTQLIKTGNCFLGKFLTRFERVQRRYTSWFRFSIPWP